MEAANVTSARRRGWSWQQIGDALGITRPVGPRQAREVGVMSQSYHPWTTYILAREEARRRGDRKGGTDHLLLGLTYEPSLQPTLGFDLERGREGAGRA